MAKRVIKKGGRVEKFNQEKIKQSLINAFEKVEILPEKKSEIIEKVLNEVLAFVKDKKEIATVEIEAKILLELDKLSPQAAQNWREYRVQKKK